MQPTLLWYEHFALPDSTFTFTIVAACVVGGHFYRRPGAGVFAALFATLFLVAGARQEGFLFLVFGVALVIQAWPESIWSIFSMSE